MSKEIVSGVAITGLLFAASFFMPVFGFFCALFIPLPVLYYRIKLGRQAGSMVAVMTAVIMVAIVGRLSMDILAFTELLLLGFVLGESVIRRYGVERSILSASGAVVASAAALVVLYSGSAGASLSEVVSEYVARNLELTMRMYENMGVSQEAIQQLSRSLEQIQYMLVRILPGLVVMSVLFVAWLNLLMGRSLLAARGLPAPSYGPLNQWQSPESLVWLVIGCGVALLLPSRLLKMIGINALLVLMTVYFFQGIAIVSFFFEKKAFPRILRLILYTLIAVQQVLAIAVIGLGFFDMWLNFRKLNKENGE